MSTLIRSIILALAMFAGGCAGNPFTSDDIAPGTPRESVIARMGQPYHIVHLANGDRMQYSLQPFGQYAWMVDVDASGKVVRARQVLTEENFHRIEPGTWTRADVEREFGRPAAIDGVASWRGPIMTYRWRDTGGGDMFYWVYLDEQGVVRRAHPGMEFHNDPPDRN